MRGFHRWAYFAGDKRCDVQRRASAGCPCSKLCVCAGVECKTLSMSACSRPCWQPCKAVRGPVSRGRCVQCCDVRERVRCFYAVVGCFVHCVTSVVFLISACVNPISLGQTQLSRTFQSFRVSSFFVIRDSSESQLVDKIPTPGQRAPPSSLGSASALRSVRSGNADCGNIR